MINIGDSQFVIKLQIVGLFILAGMQRISQCIMVAGFPRHADCKIQITRQVFGTGIRIPILDIGTIRPLRTDGIASFAISISSGEIILLGFQIATYCISHHIRI